MTQSPTVSRAISLLLEYSTGRTSPRTVDFYRQRLQPFSARFGERPISEITKEDLESFIGDLLRRDCRYPNHKFRQPVDGPLSTAYVQGYERAIRRLFLFAEERRWITADKNPWRVYRPLKKDKRVRPKACDPDDIKRLLAATAGDSPAEIRDRAILYLFIDCGCRLSGIANLRVSNIDWQNRVFETVEKGGLCVYHFSLKTAELLQKWLAIRKDLFGGGK